MSRLGKKPVDVPSGVTVTLSGQTVTTKGPKGELTFDVPGVISVEQEGDAINVTRPDDVGTTKALHGTTRAILANMVEGVSKGYEKKLEIHGVGFKADVQGKKISLNVGYADTRYVEIPDGVDVKVEGNNPSTVTVNGADKQKVGQFAAMVRAVRKPEIYKGKGIRYADEQLQMKPGKAFGAK